MGYRPKDIQPARWDYTTERLIIPGRLRDRLSSDRTRLLEVLETLQWAHGNYGLGDLSRPWEDAHHAWKWVHTALDGTTTQALIDYRERQRAA
jgi:hypothetical protein